MGILDIFKQNKHTSANIVTERVASSSAEFNAWGETPDIDFNKLIQTYLTNGSVKAAVDNMASQVWGSGIYFSHEKHDQAQLKPMYNWADDVGLIEWGELATREILFAGTTMLAKPASWATVDELTEYMVQLSSVQRIEVLRTQGSNEIIDTILHQTFSGGGATKQTSMQSIINFKWGAINRRLFGVGLAHPLLYTRTDINGDTVPALNDMQATYENAILQTMVKLPPRYWLDIDVGDEVYNTKLKPILEQQLKPGKNLVTNFGKEKLNMVEMTVGSRHNFTPIIEYFTNMSFLYLQTPLPKLFTTPGFTEASARAALEIAASYKYILQEFIRRKINMQILPIVAQINGLDKNVKLNFGQAKRVMPSTDDIHEMFRLGAITQEEYRRNMQQAVGVLLDKTPPEQQVIQQPKKVLQERLRKAKLTLVEKIVKEAEGN